MESDLGKLFIGGVSWDTDEERLRDYFSRYGEIAEVVIMRDRATGRARGFGFIVFADPSVAERVIMDKHMIDGRTVEAKKAVPRDDQHMLKQNPSPIHSSPGRGGRSKKIFVGGLPSSITKSEFKNYFDQFGIITDVVVMYDHNTQRPRGFGFITYDYEEAVDRVLQKTFHELGGKMVEVKRAVPKEFSSGSNRSPVNYGLNRSSNFFNSFAPGYNIGSIGGVGRFSPIGSGRSGFPGFSYAGYDLGMNTEPGVTPSYGGSGTTTFGNTLGYGRALNNPYYNNSLNRYTTPIGYNNSGRTDSGYNSTNRDLWGNSGTSLNPIGTTFGTNWGFSSGSGESGDSGYGRNGGRGAGGVISPFSGTNGYEGSSIGEFYRGGSVYGGPRWQPSSITELDGSSRSFGYGIDNVGLDATTNGSDGYNGSCSVANRQTNRGIAA